MHGPAAALWQARFGAVPTVDLEDAMADAASVLTGTGWASDLEHRARKAARDRGLRSAAVIDHWINYRGRFVRGADEVLPDEIWVTDDDALDIAKSEFSGVEVRSMPNLYLQQVSRAPPLRPDDRGILFFAEPVQSAWGRDRPGEFQALDYFIEHRAAAGIPADALVTPSATPIRCAE